MKWMFILLMVGLSAGSFGDAYTDLDQRVKSSLDEFKKKPTLQRFEEVKRDAQEMIRMNKQDYRGYSHLSQLYLDSRELIGDYDAYERAVEAINQYAELDDFPGKVDVSKFLAFAAPRVVEFKKEAQRKEREEAMARRQALPAMEKVRTSRELIQSYREQLSTADLKTAATLLNEVLSSDPTFWEAYVELSKVYGLRAEYEKQFAAWQLAIHFGDSTEIHLKSCTRNLRYDAMNYEVNNDVTSEKPGPSLGEFFIWLNRDLIAGYLSEEEQAEIAASTISKKERRAKRVRRLEAGGTE